MSPRRILAATVAGAACCATTALGQRPSSPGNAATGATIATTLAIPPTLTPPAQPGDLVMTTLTGTTASPDILRRARLGRIAGVILMGRNITSADQTRRLTSALQAAARAGGQPPLIIAVDQEGGTVRRLGFAAPARSAREMGRMHDDAIHAEGQTTGQDLRSVGINVDFAPVADVPVGPASFLGSRAFGTGRDRVAAAACAFAEGLTAGGVRPTFKHFPGLGASGSVNTDFARSIITRPRPLIERDLDAYRRCATDPATLVMVSNAAYRSLTGTTPAVLHPATYRLARGIGVTGPIVTDSLNAKALAGQTDVAPRIVRAGGDLLLYTSEGASVAGYRELLRAVTRGQVSRAELNDRAARVRALRMSFR